jgi:hypothetical protein
MSIRVASGALTSPVIVEPDNAGAGVDGHLESGVLVRTEQVCVDGQGNREGEAPATVGDYIRFSATRRRSRPEARSGRAPGS